MPKKKYLFKPTYTEVGESVIQKYRLVPSFFLLPPEENLMNWILCRFCSALFTTSLTDFVLAHVPVVLLPCLFGCPQDQYVRVQCQIRRH